jgi:hypothetical protein
VRRDPDDELSYRLDAPPGRLEFPRQVRSRAIRAILLSVPDKDRLRALHFSDQEIDLRLRFDGPDRLRGGVIGESESQDDRRRDAFDRLWNWTLDFGPVITFHSSR